MALLQHSPQDLQLQLFKGTATINKEQQGFPSKIGQSVLQCLHARLSKQHTLWRLQFTAEIKSNVYFHTTNSLGKKTMDAPETAQVYCMKWHQKNTGEWPNKTETHVTKTSSVPLLHKEVDYLTSTPEHVPAHTRMPKCTHTHPHKQSHMSEWSSQRLFLLSPAPGWWRGAREDTKPCVCSLTSSYTTTGSKTTTPCVFRKKKKNNPATTTKKDKNQPSPLPLVSPMPSGPCSVRNKQPTNQT